MALQMATVKELALVLGVPFLFGAAICLTLWVPGRLIGWVVSALFGW